MGKFISVDIEADGPVPGLFSVVSIGAVVVEKGLDRKFYVEMAPLDGASYNESNLKICGFTREQTLGFLHPENAMLAFDAWLRDIKERPIFLADNPGFDFAFINYYFHKFCGANPFGWSSRRIGDIWCGRNRDLNASWKKLRETKHSHNALDDAVGNAEAFLKITEGFKDWRNK